MQSYPLYDELLKRVHSRNEKSVDIKRVCTTINNISQTHSSEETMEHFREIAALNLHHDVLSNTGFSTGSIPYEGKVMVGGKGLLYQITKLPPLLQQIIAQYIEDPNCD